MSTASFGRLGHLLRWLGLTLVVLLGLQLLVLLGSWTQVEPGPTRSARHQRRRSTT